MALAALRADGRLPAHFRTAHNTSSPLAELTQRPDPRVLRISTSESLAAPGVAAVHMDRGLRLVASLRETQSAKWNLDGGWPEVEAEGRSENMQFGTVECAERNTEGQGVDMQAGSRGGKTGGKAKRAKPVLADHLWI